MKTVTRTLSNGVSSGGKRRLSSRVTRGIPPTFLNKRRSPHIRPGSLSAGVHRVDHPRTYGSPSHPVWKRCKRTYGAPSQPPDSTRQSPTLIRKQSSRRGKDEPLPPPTDSADEEAVQMRQIVSIIGAPMVFGQKLVGTEQGPDALRDSGLQDRIRHIDGGSFLVEDLGNLELPQRSRLGPKGHFADVIGTGNQMICEKWFELGRDPSKFILLLGGDHSVGLGSMLAAITTRPDTVVIWVDAHADLNTPLTSLSGSYHGMPVGIAMRLAGWPENIREFDWMKDYGTLNPKNLVYIGLRDLDAAEKRSIKELGIKSYTMHHIDRLGIGQVMQEVMDYVGGRPMHMSFDIDACDPFFAGSTGTHVRGGLTFRETQYICEVLADSGELGSMDLVEVNPNLSAHTSTDTCEAAITVIESCLGKSLL